MRIETDPLLPPAGEGMGWSRNLTIRLTELFRKIAVAVNEEKHEATAAPTTSLWQQGQFVRNSTPTELGTAGSKYIIRGWVCVVSGEPGTWVEARSLTGN